MADFFNRMLGRNSSEEKGSGTTAKDRLKMVLTHDRIQVSPEKLNEMRAEIIAVIAKYVPEIDPDSVDVSIEQTDRFNNRIVAQIPFSKSRGAAMPISEDATTVNEEDTDLKDISISDAATVPKLDEEDRAKITDLPKFNPDDDEPTFIIEAEDAESTDTNKQEDDKTLSKLDDDTSEAEENSTEAVNDDNDSSDDTSSDDDQIFSEYLINLFQILFHGNIGVVRPKDVRAYIQYVQSDHEASVQEIERYKLLLL